MMTMRTRRTLVPSPNDPGTPSKAPKDQANSANPSSQDEYGLRDLDGLEAELLAEAENAESAEGLRPVAQGLSSQEWFKEFMMGTQELKDIGLG